MMGESAMKPFFQPMSAHGPSPEQMNAAVQQALNLYPALTTQPLAVTKGTGPYQSETYLPKDPENPLPGTLNIELRSQRSKNLQTLPQWIGFEGIHGLQQTDPVYQQFHKQFVKSMTPDQLASAKQRYEQMRRSGEEQRSFDQFLNIAEAPEYIRGYLFSNVIPGWVGPKGEGQYSPEQVQILNRMLQYITRTPQSPLGSPR